MIKLSRVNIKHKKDWQIVALLTVLYTVFLISKYILNQPEIWNHLNNSFLFYFDGTLSNYKTWYPKYGFWFFSIVLLFKFFITFLLLYGLCFFSIQIKSQFLKFNPNSSLSFKSLLSKQIKILGCLLIYYIGLYFIYRLYFSYDFFNFQILIARGFLFQLCFQIISNLVKLRIQLIHYLKSFLFEPQLPYSISILRILFFSYLAFIYFAQYIEITKVTLKTKVNLPYIGWLIEVLPVNAQIYKYFIGLGIVSCLFIVIGLKTRLFLLVNAVCVFYVIATPNFFGKLWHNQIIIWIVWFLMFSKCYDVFSIDSIRKKTEVIKSANYTFPVRFILIQFGIIYFWAGFYKLWDSGFDWTFGSSMINQVQLEWVQGYDKVPTIRIDKVPILLYFGGLIVIVFELAYILFVFKPKWRWVSFIGGLTMHNMIGYFMYISFLPVLQVFYIFYIDFNQFFKKKINQINIKPNFSKVSFFTGCFILTVNMIFGMFSIHSYPFSSYPSYSAIIPDTFKMICFVPNHLNRSVHDIGKHNNFRWEDYGWLENNLIQDFEKGKDVQKRLNDYWEIWVKSNPQLQKCDTVQVYLIERPVAPEGKNQIKIVNKMPIIIQK